MRIRHSTDMSRKIIQQAKDLRRQLARTGTRHEATSTARPTCRSSATDLPPMPFSDSFVDRYGVSLSWERAARSRYRHALSTSLARKMLPLGCLDMDTSSNLKIWRIDHTRTSCYLVGMWLMVCALYPNSQSLVPLSVHRYGICQGTLPWPIWQARPRQIETSGSA